MFRRPGPGHNFLSWFRLVASGCRCHIQLILASQANIAWNNVIIIMIIISCSSRRRSLGLPWRCIRKVYLQTMLSKTACLSEHFVRRRKQVLQGWKRNVHLCTPPWHPELWWLRYIGPHRCSTTHVRQVNTPRYLEFAYWYQHIDSDIIRSQVGREPPYTNRVEVTPRFATKKSRAASTSAIVACEPAQQKIRTTRMAWTDCNEWTWNANQKTASLWFYQN